MKNKDLFNILPLTKIYIYIYINTRLKFKKKIKHKHNKNLSTIITQGLLIRPIQKKTQNKSYQKKKKIEGPNKREVNA